jgi:beta-phosphoglucomutase-like phosphatase (HAD superfamily)
MQVVFEYEGVVVEDNARLHSEAWAQVAEEEDKPRPLHFALQRAQGMKNEQVRFHSYRQLLYGRIPYMAFLKDCRSGGPSK